MTPWLAIIGIGEDGLAGLAPAARALIDSAEILAGGKRHLAFVPNDQRERLVWGSPLESSIDALLKLRGRKVCLLASGDPFCYGIGATLAPRVPPEEMTVIPAPSAFSLACARLGWPLPDCETLSLHGRPLELLHSFLQPGARLLLLTSDGATPAAVARLLVARGYGESRMIAFERLAGEAEQRHEATAAAWMRARIGDLNTLAVECRAAPEAPLLSRVPGLPDEAYRHDGQLTKHEVRAVTLAALVPVPGQLLWDVGAGCGSIAIEWLRAARNARAFAIERDERRVILIAGNAATLGVPQLEIVTGEAPAALEGLPAPDAIFLGGGLSDAKLIEFAWARLATGGRLVANAVTLEGEETLLSWREKSGGSLTRLAVSRAQPVGGYLGWRPLMPVTQLSARKP